jgi:hypothetical protein
MARVPRLLSREAEVNAIKSEVLTIAIPGAARAQRGEAASFECNIWHK